MQGGCQGLRVEDVRDPDFGATRMRGARGFGPPHDGDDAMTFGREARQQVAGIDPVGAKNCNCLAHRILQIGFGRLTSVDEARLSAGGWAGRYRWTKAIGQRFGGVDAGDVGSAIQIGNRARDLEDAVIGAG